MNALLPADRKLIPMTLRGSDWKALKSNGNVDVNTKSLIYAYWHFEATLKEHYFGKTQHLDANKIKTSNLRLFFFFFVQNFYGMFKVQFKEHRIPKRSKPLFIRPNC